MPKKTPIVEVKQPKPAAVPVGQRLRLDNPDLEIVVGDCREVLPTLDAVKSGSVDLVFADPPFNWKRAYDRWDDDMPEKEYLDFTYDWLDLCVKALRPGGALWVNIPDDWAAEIVCYLKGRLARKPGTRENGSHTTLSMANWCIWHYRFGQNTTDRFINSKVHTLYFIKQEGLGPRQQRTWNTDQILELSDRATTYFDPRTLSKADGMPAGKRVPMDVWYGQYWGRVQGNNTERRGYHDNQLPEAYLERVILACSNEGDLVMDPFTGSGTTAVVAHDYKRRFIGTEFSPENATSAFERVKLGMVRKGKALHQSSAIFRPRGQSKTSKYPKIKAGM
jgi:site-specific DNA-methyltransferase (adenine-specific)